MEVGVTVRKDISGRIIVTFPYAPLRVQKAKTIPGHRWHPDKKHWSFPDSDGTLERILKVFEGEKIHIAPALKTKLPTPVIARRHELNKETTAFKGTVPDLRTERSGVPSLVIARHGVPKQSQPFGTGPESGLSPKYGDLRRELLSRKYSYRTVKGYKQKEPSGCK